MPARKPPPQCAHGRTRWRCKDCGSGYCQHGKQKSQCRACGRGYCEHRARKDRCPQCGTTRCPHGLLRSRCSECVPLVRLQRLSTQCAVCGITQVCRRRSRARGGSGLCAACDGRSAVRKEKVLAAALQDQGVPPPSAVDDRVIGGPQCGVGRRRPDIAWVTPTHVVNLEVDEDSHAARQPSCEVSKAQDTRYGVEHGSKPLLLIRYNPDQYDGPGLQGAADRVAYLAKVVLFCLRNVDARGLDLLRPNVVFLFYHSRSQKHVDAAMAVFPTLVLPAPPPETKPLPAGLAALRALYAGV